MYVDFSFFKKLGFNNKKTVAFVKALQEQGLCVLNVTPQGDKKSKVQIFLSPNFLDTLFSEDAKAVTNTDLLELTPKTLFDDTKAILSNNYEAVKQLKASYPINRVNRYFKHFTNGHKQQFVKSFAARIDKGKLDLEKLEEVFSLFPQKENFSLADIFTQLQSSTYTLSDILFDFIWIQTEGKISSISMEAKGKKALIQLLENGTTSLAEIEDCWLFMLNGDINYTLSLVSLSKALQQFQKFRVILPDGRYGFQMRLDKTKASAYTQSMNNFQQWANS